MLAEISTVGAAVMGGSLLIMGTTAINSPTKGATSYGLPSTGIHWVPVWGARDAGFGIAIISLIAAGKTGVLSAGEWQRAVGIVTLAGAGVGAMDAWILAKNNVNGVLGHAVGASAMATFAFGLWYSSQ